MTDRENVHAAALYMDEIKPDWFEQVNTTNLQMSSAERCICGQNGLDWESVKDEFYARCDPSAAVFSDPILKRFWVEEIAARAEAVPA